MGLFDMFKKENPEEVKVDLEKKVNLAKEEVHKVVLTKPVLNGLKAHVCLVLDYSGSMDLLYKNGTVQEVIEKILPLALEFDDDGQMEVWIFEDGFKRLPDIKLGNLHDYVNREILKKYHMGGTCYSPVIADVVKAYGDLKLPSYCLFLTDGDNFDKAETDDIMRKASYKQVFWQFVGLGRGPFNYLEHLDDMEGRYVDNADFFQVKDIDGITYKDLLNEFPTWLQETKVKAMLT
jgi:hypothetical protein